MTYSPSRLLRPRPARWLAGIAALLIAGCDSPSGYPDVHCPAPTPAHAHGEGPVFVLDLLTIDQSDSPDVGHTGFDLDGLASTDESEIGCAHSDFFALFDNDQNCSRVERERCVDTAPSCWRRSATCSMGAGDCHAAVDNQMPTLANTFVQIASIDPRQTLADSVTTSQFAIAVQVVDIDDPVNDPSVRVRLFRAHAAPGSSCMQVVAGSSYQIDRASVGPAGTLDDAIVELAGEIVNGRVRAGGDDVAALTIPMLIVNPALLEIRRLRVAFDFSAGEIRNGNLGGYVRGESLKHALIEGGVPENYAQAIAEGTGDIAIDGLCSSSTTSPPRFAGVSVGYGLHGVPAVIDPATPVIDGPAPGSCEQIANADGGVADASDAAAHD